MTLHRLAPPIAPGFIEGLEEMVAHAKAGHLRGAVVLLNYADTYAHWKGGHIPFDSAITALESWKWHEFSKRFSAR